MKITWYTTLSGDCQWSDYKNGNSDPLDDIKNAVIGIRERFGKQPNFIKTSMDVIHTFIRHPDVIELITNAESPENCTVSYNSIFKSMFSIKEIEIDNTMRDRMLIAYKENDKIYPDEKAVFEIRGIL